MKFDLFSPFQEFLATQRENLLLWVPIFWGVGSAIYFSLPTEPSFLKTGSGLAGSIILFLSYLRLYTRKHDSVAVLVSLILSACVVCIFVGFTAAQIKTDIVKTPMVAYETRPVMVTGIIDHREDQEGKKGILLFVSNVSIEKWEPQKTPKKIRITVRKQTDVAAGDTVKFLAKLTPLSPPVAPDAYDFARHYYFDGIGALGYALSGVEVIGRADKGIFNLENTRTHISNVIKDVVPERQAGIVSALMTGERAAIFDDDWNALRASGLAHIISISGLHVVMVATPVFFLVRLLLSVFPFIALRFPIKKIAAAAALLVCCLYVGLVVPSVPTTRALLMTGIGLFAIMIDRSPFSLRLVAFSAILVLLVSPESVWSVSFQMSFAAVTCLVAVAESLRPTLIKFYADAGWIKKAGLFIGGSIMTSMVASIATAPYSLYHFQQIASYSVLANTISVPLSGLIIMPMLILSYVLMPFGAAGWSLKLMGQGVDWLLDVARWTQNLSGSVITTGASPELAMVMVTFAGLILILFQGKGKYLCLIPICVAVISMMTFSSPDILVSDEGKVMAIKDGGKIYISSARRDKFTVETWIKRWNATDITPIPFPHQGKIDLQNGGYISCDPAACRMDVHGRKISFGGARFYELREDCAWADIIISEARVPRGFCGDKPVQVFGYYNFQQSGAMAIYSDGIIRAVGEGRGYRPWALPK